jgi:isopentenyldiphosphate isomerase
MELLDVVNSDDVVVGTVPFDEVYEKKLPHRIVHVLLFNDFGEMALQLRSEKKSFCPLHWSTGVGGHVQAGESYEEAAYREFEEELGKKASISFINKYRYEGAGFTKHLAIFKTVYPGPFQINPEEVKEVKFFSLPKIEEMIKSEEKFHPELLFLLQNINFS